MTNEINENDLDWVALCYATGELDAAATEQFEVRLADDQAAREALARVVELTQTVAAVEAQSPAGLTFTSASPTGWNTRLSWMAIGGVAAALLAMLWSGVINPTWRSAVRQLNSGSQYNLAMAWQQTGSEIDRVKASGLWPSVPTMEDDEDRQADFHLVSHQIDDEALLGDAPSWMTAAVYGISDQTNVPETVVQ